MKATEAAVQYYLHRHELYHIRTAGGSGTPEERRVASRLVRLRRHLQPDGGIEVTRHIDALVTAERSET